MDGCGVIDCPRLTAPFEAMCVGTEMSRTFSIRRFGMSHAIIDRFADLIDLPLAHVHLPSHSP